MTTGVFGAGLGPAVGRRELDLVTPAAAVAIPLQYAYIFAFNHAPEGIRTAIAVALLLVHVTLAGFALSRRIDAWQTAILSAIFLMVGCWLIAHGANPKSTEFNIVYAVRDLSILVMPLWLLTFPERLPHRMILLLAIGSTVAGGLIALLGPPVFVSGTPRLASITGGPVQMHASAMFLALQLILLTEYYRGRQLFGAIYWPLCLFAVAVLIGYGGRNEFVILASYFGALAYFRYSYMPVVRWSPPIVLVFVVMMAALALTFGHNVGEWGSGRIGVWQNRLELIWGRNVLTFLFGGGLSADLIWNPQWWWMDEVNAHNDFLHFTMKTGLVGLLAILLFLGGLLMRMPGSSKAIIIALILSSFFSNGFLQTPLLAFNLFLVVAVGLHQWRLRAERIHNLRVEHRRLVNRGMQAV
ncbi:MAG: hypothetical protein JNM48_15335 [Rhodospirillales bacterium]|nr:hypothetical protein [Rhodospirillales bacterium]